MTWLGCFCLMCLRKNIPMLVRNVGLGNKKSGPFYLARLFSPK